MFTAQRMDGRIVHDFVFTLVQSKEYYDWAGEAMGIVYVNSTDELVGIHANTVPVGSVEFIKEFINKFWPTGPHPGLVPLNVPDCLFPWAGRKIKNITVSEDLQEFDPSKRVFIKSTNTIKDPGNGMFWLSEIDLSNIVDCYQMSEEIDILSEWRVLVFRNKVVYIANYSGDPLMFPNRGVIEDMIKIYERNDAPVAYTLDVGVNETEGTFIVECHRFFSCGLYGFCDYKLYPKMLSQAWFEMKRLG